MLTTADLPPEWRPKYRFRERAEGVERPDSLHLGGSDGEVLTVWSERGYGGAFIDEKEPYTFTRLVSDGSGNLLVRRRTEPGGTVYVRPARSLDLDLA